MLWVRIGLGGLDLWSCRRTGHWSVKGIEEETGISLIDNLGKVVVQDLCGDPLSFVLIISQLDTLSIDRFVEASHWLFYGQLRGASDDAAQIKMVGVARIRKSKQGYAFETYLTGKPTWEQVVDLMSDDLQGRLSPAAKFIPFNNPFSSIVELPTVSWQMGEYLTHEMAEADTPLRRGGGRAGRFIFEFQRDDGKWQHGWAAEGAALSASYYIPAYYVHTPEELATTNQAVASLLATQYNDCEVRMGHKDLIPSLIPIPGDVLHSSIRAVRLNVCLSVENLHTPDVENTRVCASFPC